MRFVIDAAKPIKPMVIRFTVLVYEEDDLSGEYEIAVDIEPYVQYDISEEATNINIDAIAIQQYLTNSIAEMQITNIIANGFLNNNLDWTANQEDEEVVEDNEPAEAATGDTIKLPSDVSAGK